MSFLNVALLGGIVAMLVPLVIHWLNRSQFQTVDWGAMHLLESALRVNSRRLQWKSTLLLLLRCLIPILFALGLARPVLTKMRMTGAGGELSLALLADASRSMLARGGNEASSMEIAQRELLALAKRYRAAEASLWTVGGQPTDELDGTTVDTVRLQNGLQGLQAGQGQTDVLAALTAGIGRLREMNHPSRQLVFASDFRAADWSGIDEARLNQIREQLTSSELPIQVSFLKTSPQTMSTDTSGNLSVHFASREDSRIVADEARPFLVEVHNFGEHDSDGVQVVLNVDGRDVSQRTVDVPAGAVQQVFWTCQFADPGWHAIACRLEAEDQLVEDNYDGLVVEVGKAWDVLLVSSSDPQGAADDGRFLRLALAPFTTEDGTENRFHVEQLEATQLRPEAIGVERDVVVLAGVPRLDDPVAKALVDFVQGGGGLLIFPGPQLDADWYNQRFGHQDAILPLAFDGLTTEDAGQRLLRERIQFPRLEVFNSGQAGDLFDWEVQRRQTLLPRENDHSQAWVLLRFEDGLPFLAMRNVGSGRVFQCAVSCADEWSNLPLKPAYVPFMQQLTLAATVGAQVPNITCGQTMNFFAGGESGSVTGAWLAVREPYPSEPTAPNEQSVALVADVEGRSLRFSDTRYPGLYKLRSEDPSSTNGSTLPPKVTIGAEVRESDLRPLSDERLAAIADSLGATVVHDAEEFSHALELRQQGREIWRWWILALLGLLFAEILVARGLGAGGAP